MPSFRWSQQSLTAKVLTISAIGIGVGFGTCTFGFVTNVGRASSSNITIPAGAILFFTSLAAFIITALIALGTMIARSFRK